MNILHLSDPHLFADTAKSLRGTVSYESLAQVLEHYRHSNWNADLVYVTGDLVQDDSERAYQHFCDQLLTLNLPVYGIPGNHDVPPLMKQVFELRGLHYLQSVRAAQWCILPLDSSVPGEVAGLVSADDLDHLVSAIEAESPRHILLAVHHPPVSIDSQWLDAIGMRNGAQLLEMAAATGRVRGIIFGHVHQSVETTHGSMSIIGTPATCAQFLPRAERFAVDDRGPAYRRLTLARDGAIENELVWI